VIFRQKIHFSKVLVVWEAKLYFFSSFNMFHKHFQSPISQNKDCCYD